MFINCAIYWNSRMLVANNEDVIHICPIFFILSLNIFIKSGVLKWHIIRNQDKDETRQWTL